MMNFIETILPSLRVWQFFCLSPFALTEKTRWPKIERNFNMYCLIYIATECVVLLHGIIFPQYYLDLNAPPISKYGDFVTMTLTRVVAIFCVIESWQKRSLQIKFFGKINKIDSILAVRLNIDLRHEANRRETTWKSIIWLLSIISLHAIFLTVLLINPDPESQRLMHFWLGYMVPFTVSSLRYHQMVTFVRLVRHRSGAINNFLKQICSLDERAAMNNDLMNIMRSVDKTLSTKFEPDDCKMLLYNQLIEIRAAYQQLYDASQDINVLFRWTLPINIAIDFQKGLTNIYFVITLVLTSNSESSNAMTALLSMLWGIFNIGHILVLSSACQQTTEESQLIPGLLHNVDFNLSDLQSAGLVCVRRNNCARRGNNRFRFHRFDCFPCS